MDDRDSRREARRRTWRGGVAKSFEEIDAIDLEWWLAQPPEERLGYVFDMWDEQMRLKDEAHEAAARLERDIGGVRPRRG